jgi:hypothetical protein
LANINIKWVAAPVSEAGPPATTTTDEKVAVLKSTYKKHLDLSSQKFYKNSKNKGSKNKGSKNKCIAERVINLEAESKATQQAIALLKQILFEFARARKEDLARERERRF